MEQKILVVEDEPRILRLVTEILRSVGFTVVGAGDAKTAMEMLVIEQPELILLDILLPHGANGYELCERIREFSDVPVIMLTAKAQENDILRGFDAGADDYLTKPFSAKELLARVRAVLRRTYRPEEKVTTAVHCGELEIDFARHKVWARGEQVPLTRTEYALLRQLALNPNKIISHEGLLTSVWGPEYRNDVDYIRAYVWHLRRKLECDPSNPRLIVTSPGVGYMLVCDE
jgi:two-component system, OmpR family, KDP operon response regulator KdpE